MRDFVSTVARMLLECNVKKYVRKFSGTLRTLLLHHPLHDSEMRVVGRHRREVGHFDFHLGGTLAAVAETERVSIAGPSRDGRRGGGGVRGVTMAQGRDNVYRAVGRLLTPLMLEKTR